MTYRQQLLSGGIMFVIDSAPPPSLDDRMFAAVMKQKLADAVAPHVVIVPPRPHGQHA